MSFKTFLHSLITPPNLENPTPKSTEDQNHAFMKLLNGNDEKRKSEAKFKTYPIDKKRYPINNIDTPVLLYDIIKKNNDLHHLITNGMSKWSDPNIEKLRHRNQQISVNTISHLNELASITISLSDGRLIDMIRSMYTKAYLNDVITQYFQKHIDTKELSLYEDLRTKGTINDQMAYLKTIFIPTLNSALKDRIDIEVYPEFDNLVNHITHQYNKKEWTKDIIGYKFINHLKAQYLQSGNEQQLILNSIQQLKTISDVINYGYVMGEYILNGPIDYRNNSRTDHSFQQCQNQEQYFYHVRNELIKRANQIINDLQHQHPTISFKNPFDDMNLKTSVSIDHHNALSQISEFINLKALYQHQAEYDLRHHNDTDYWSNNVKLNPYPYFKLK